VALVARTFKGQGEDLVATGLHRPMSVPEIRDRLGPEVPGDIAVENHEATNEAHMVTLDPPEDGVPVVLDRRVVEADLVVATGMVEPHLYAGFSGGWKTVSIGCAGEPTIAATHGPRFLDRPGTRLGLLEGNPFQEVVAGIGRR
jgi:nickel-dependent lactate racemase